jgi:hypothetical protein
MHVHAEHDMHAHACRYPATGSPAVLIHSDGSASLSWPEGSMAATLDPENHVVPGSMASTSSSAGAPAPIKGYRLLAMYRTITGVAASFDSTGGFVQWPSGQLMLVWNRKDGTAYGPDGRVTHTFNNRRCVKAHHTQWLCTCVASADARTVHNFSSIRQQHMRLVAEGLPAPPWHSL